MGSINAKNVALEVLETVRKGKKVNLGKIIKKHGYADTTSTVPSQVTDTKSFQEVIEPVVEQMEKERQRLIKSISIKDLDVVKYKDAVEALDKLTKNIQLLNGGKTSNDSIELSWE